MHIKHTLLLFFSLQFQFLRHNWYRQCRFDIGFDIKININILITNIKNQLVLAVGTDTINMREVLFLQTIYLNHCFEKLQKSKNVLHHKLLYNYCISKNIFVPFGLRFYWKILNKNMKMIIMMNIIHGYCSQRVLFFFCISTSPDNRSGTVVVIAFDLAELLSPARDLFAPQLINSSWKDEK